MRIAITGAPRTGKSTLAMTLGLPVYCTDPLDLVKNVMEEIEYVPEGFGWSDSSLYVCDNFLTRPGPFVVEGVGVPRALRKYKKNTRGAKPPIDKLIIMTKNFETLRPGQAAMGKGLMTVFYEIEPWLRQGGVEIESR